MPFEWDPAKDRANQRKHGLSFKEATRLFTRHSHDEDRFVAIGPIRRGVIVVAYTERHEDTIRLVSARLATRSETRQFRAYWREKNE